ncbi:C6 transcription factor [Fusarium albosuccineum]|uniref:C6 transcription factor n=1 Tax=Fusarium albosuccineum TaxID=1237068 RepID=A0A8H4L4Y8_9HYPO|nr:C6 transcription factor [Fusarium albosuccineum]
MVLKIWFWCGGRSKMELAEGFSHPVITILRRSGVLRAATQTSLELNETDCGDELQRKWLLWVEKESWVRLVHAMFSHDAEASMTLLINPSLSYTEMKLTLPSEDGLWGAKTAEKWKLQMLSHESDRHRSLSMTACLRSIFNSGTLRGGDLAPSTLMFTLYGLWGLIWEYRQAHHMLRVGDLFCGLDGLTLTSRFDALAKALDVLRRAVEILISKDGSHYSAQSLAELNTVLEFNAMALCAPLRTLPAFAGKYGETEAQRLYPVVEDWVQSREARQAIWHAGQVYKWAKDLECQHMRDFQSVAVYHASLVFWVYGIIMSYRNEQESVSLDQPTQCLGRAILLDGAMSLDNNNFIANGLGIPAIEDVASRLESPTALVPLYNPSRTMKVGLGILRKGASQCGSLSEGGTPTFVVALVQLMNALGNAADTIGLG